MKPFSLAAGVAERAASLGVKGDATKALWEMYQNSAPFSHPQGNRRFGQIMFLVKDNTVLSIDRIAEDLVLSRHQEKKDRYAKKGKPQPRLYDLTR